jgi:glutathione synthase
MFVIGILMDSIESIDFRSDSTISIIKCLQNKSDVKLIDTKSIYQESNTVYGTIYDIKIDSIIKSKYVLSKRRHINLNKLDCVFFRKDPPVDTNYISLLQILKKLEYQNTLILNSPDSLLRFNEKILGYELSNPKIPTLIGSNMKKIKAFLDIHKDIVLKPMNMMAGKGIVRLKVSKDSTRDINEYLKKYKIVIAQKYLKEIKNGDNRIIIYDGIIHDKVMTRYPSKNDFRANLACGGSYEIKEINKSYLPLLDEIASLLKYHGIFFAGVDMIGKYVSEINITSPTGLQQIGKGLSSKISNKLLDKIRIFHMCTK